MSKRLKISVNILTTHERVGWICPALSQWIMDLPYIAGDVCYTVTPWKNFMPAASARNEICWQAKQLEPRPDWILMVDNDMAPYLNQNLFDILTGAPEDASVIVPQFQMWDEARAECVLCWGMDEKHSPIKDGTQKFTLDPNKFYEINKCGTGVIFIRPHVFDVISMPYFWYDYNEKQGLEGTEDIKFAKKVVGDLCARCGLEPKLHDKRWYGEKLVKEGSDWKVITIPEHEFVNAGLKMYGNSGFRVGHYHNVNLDILARRIYPPEPIDSGVIIKAESSDLEKVLP